MSPAQPIARVSHDRISQTAVDCVDRFAASAPEDRCMPGSPFALPHRRNEISRRQEPACRRCTTWPDGHCDIAPPVKFLLVRSSPITDRVGNTHPYERATAAADVG